MKNPILERSRRRPASRAGLVVALLTATLTTLDGSSRQAVAAPDTAKPAPVTSGNPKAAEVPAENPLRAADAAAREQALSEAWVTFQSACRPCHGNLGAGDGPYARAFAREAADLRHPSRDIVADAIRFVRIRDGAATLPQRPWESSMPAFGEDLDTQKIWGLVLLLDDLGKDGTGLDPDISGADLYAHRCAVCHGAKGAGDGPLAAELMPPPRDFVRGQYRMRSTESGAAPIDNDILTVAVHGLGDTAMGRFVPLGGDQMEAVSKYVETFAPTVFASEPATVPAGSRPMREPIEKLTTRGRAVYDEARCSECHGESGRGNGPSAATLKDEKGRLSIATNLTKRWHAKGTGGSPGVFHVLSTGLNGTPMASYASSLSEDDRWAVGYYLERLSRPYPKFSPSVQAGIVTEQVPSDPTAPFWKTIPATTVPLGPQVVVPPYWTQPAIDAVDVTVAVNKDQIGILLVWDDPTRDEHADDAGNTSTVAAALARYGTWRLPDQVAVQFPEKADPKGILPTPYLGAAERPVVRWIWSADRQARGEHQAVVERVAGARAKPEAMSGSAPVQTAATYADGQWRVVLLGARPPKAATSTTMALQSWNGSTGESGHWHGLSGWLTVNLR